MNGVNKSRFCYSYKPPGTVENCCIPKLCATNDHIALISSLQIVTYNSTKTSERSLLLHGQKQYLEEVQVAKVNSTVQTTIANSATIASNIYGQLLQVKKERYEPYQPYIYPTIPQSVIQLQMSTINVGVPNSFFTVADCKANQSVTNTTDSIINNIAVTGGQVKWATYYNSFSNVIGIASDSSDNVYIIGRFRGTINLYNYSSPPINSFEIITSIYGSLTTTNPIMNEVYIIKYNSNGSVEWATTLYSSNDSYGYSIICDISDNVYVSGFYSFSSPLTINNYSSPPINNGPVNLSVYGKLINLSRNDIFIVKYNSAGLAQWATTISGLENELNYSLITDSIGDLYISGTSSSNPIIFNNYNSPPIGGGFVGLLKYGDLIGSGNDIFLAKYSSVGKAQWATNIQGTFDIFSYGPSISIDSSNNIYLAGSYNTVPVIINNFDNYVSSTISTSIYGTLANISNFDIFIVKYNSSGSAIWATSIGVTSSDDINYSISSDIQGNVSITGYYVSNTLQINNFVNTSSSSSLINVTLYGTLANTTSVRNAFIVKYDSNGQAQWASNIISTIDCIGTTVANDLHGNVYVAGNYVNNISLYNFKDTPVLGGAIQLDLYGKIDCSGTNNMFLVKYNSLGKIQWVTTCIVGSRFIGSLTADPVITVTSSGYIYISGRFLKQILINNYMYSPNSLGQVGLNPYCIISSSEQFNVFIIKYTQ